MARKIEDHKENKEKLLKKAGFDSLIELIQTEQGDEIKVFSNTVKLIFMLEGEEELFAGRDYHKTKVKKGNFFLLPIDEQVFARTTQAASMLKVVISVPSCSLYDYLPFEYYSTFKVAQQNEKNNTPPSAQPKRRGRGKAKTKQLADSPIIPLTINEKMQEFLDILLADMAEGKFQQFKYLKIKQEELFFILRQYYPIKQLVEFFYNITYSDMGFAKVVFDNLNKIHSAADIGKLMNYSTSGAKKRFSIVFNEPLSQWLDNYKAKRLYYDMLFTDKKIMQLAKEYGFCSSSHITHFCLRMYGMPPLKLKRQIREKYNRIYKGEK